MERTKAANIRWMIRRDMPEVLEIENLSYEWPWIEDDFLQLLRARNVIGMIVECSEKVVAFMVYELHKPSLKVVNMTVHPQYRRQGFSAAMVEKLTSKLSTHRRKKIEVMVRESDMEAQCFLRAMKFVAVNVSRGDYDDTDEDGYLFQFRIDGNYPERCKPKPESRRGVCDVDISNRVSGSFRRK